MTRQKGIKVLGAGKCHGSCGARGARRDVPRPLFREGLRGILGLGVLNGLCLGRVEGDLGFRCFERPLFREG